MIGLYLVVVLVLWLLLTWMLLKYGWLKLAQGEDRITSRLVLFGLAISAWFILSFWYGGGRKLFYDWRIDRMCAIDGGVRLFEPVFLPPESFDAWGMVNFYSPALDENALGINYKLKSFSYFYSLNNPRLARHHYQITRRADGKVLGETVLYGRGGGDFIGPWHQSSYTCPYISSAGLNVLLKSVFIKSQEVRDE